MTKVIDIKSRREEREEGRKGALGEVGFSPRTEEEKPEKLNTENSTPNKEFSFTGNDQEALAKVEAEVRRLHGEQVEHPTVDLKGATGVSMVVRKFKKGFAMDCGTHHMQEEAAELVSTISRVADELRELIRNKNSLFGAGLGLSTIAIIEEKMRLLEEADAGFCMNRGLNLVFMMAKTQLTSFTQLIDKPFLLLHASMLVSESLEEGFTGAAAEAVAEFVFAHKDKFEDFLFRGAPAEQFRDLLCDREIEELRKWAVELLLKTGTVTEEGPDRG